MREGLSGASVLRSLREAGLGFRTQDFYRRWGAARKEIGAESEILALEPHQRAPAHLIGEWGASEGNEGFMHIVEFTRLNRITHQPETSGLVIKNSELLTKGEAEATAEEILRENEKEYPEYRTLDWAMTAVRRLVPET